VYNTTRGVAVPGGWWGGMIFAGSRAEGRKSLAIAAAGFTSAFAASFLAFWVCENLNASGNTGGNQPRAFYSLVASDVAFSISYPGGSDGRRTISWKIEPTRTEPARASLMGSGTICARRA